jgi:hypothetical protein
MKLTSENINKIDNYLKENSISYWDIRLEMIDHVACKIESKKGSYDFESLFKHTIHELGWEKDLKAFEAHRLKTINKTIRKKYFKTTLELFTNFKSLVFIVLFSATYYFILQDFSSKVFGIVTMIFLAVPVLGFTAHCAYTSIKLKKSGYLVYGYFYLTFSILMTSLFYQLPRPGGIFEVSLMTWHNIVFFTTIFNVFFISSGIKVYLKIHKQYNEAYKRLNTD